MRIKMTALAVLAVAGSAWCQQAITVGPNVQVSKVNGSREHNEVILAADPNDAKHLLAGSMVYNPKKSDYNNVTYVSFDGGKSWQATLEVDSEMGLDGDPSTAFGCDGTAFSVNLSVTGRRYQNQTQVRRSPDGGKTWLKPTLLPFSDREYIVVDCQSQAYKGRVYIHANGVTSAADGVRVSNTRIFKSEDGGQSFRENVFPPPANRRSTYQGIPVVLSDGTFLGPYTDIPYDLSNRGKDSSLLRVFRSTDGGNSFETSTIGKLAEPQGGGAGDIGLPNLAVDLSPGPFHDRVYAVWAERGTDRCQIKLSYSKDKGKTWSKPITVNDDQPFSDGRKGPDDIMGEVAVNNNGVVGVSWYDRRDSRNDYDWTVRFATSFDGGNIFGPSVKISEAPFVHDWSKSLPVSLISFGGGNYHDELASSVLQVGTLPDRSFYHGGDTAGLVADASGVFHALWIDNRTGVAQAWTSTIDVSGKAVRHGIAELQDLEDVTEKVMLKFGDASYNPATRTVSGKAFLVNTSEVTLASPMVVRVLGFESGTGEILNADNRQRGPGAIWDFTSLLEGKKLEPGKHTQGKYIEFRVPEQATPSRSDNPSRGRPFPSITAQALGKLENSKVQGH